MDKYNFRNTSDYGNYVITEQLETNLASWLEWSLLGIGAFQSVTRSSTIAYGGDPSKLKPANDPRYATNTVWQGNRSDWCWESGIAYNTQPIHVSGVWVNGTFSTPTGTYPHYINYPLGQVVFSGTVSTTSVVQVERSQKFVTVKRSDDPWFKSIMNGSLRVDDIQFSGTGTTPGSGQWTQLGQNRVVLPILVVEPVMNANGKPYELGNTSRIHKEDFLIHVITETPWDRKRLVSILNDQYDKRIISFDMNSIDFPLDYRGTPTASAMTYPQLCEAHPWLQIRVPNIISVDNEPIGNKVWWSTCRFSLELDTP